MRVSVVGVCGVGKSSLVSRLRYAGYDAHEVAQEHSYVPDMWRRLHPPRVLIFLDANLDTVWRRRPGTLLSQSLYQDMQARLAHARENAGLFISTDNLTEEEVAGTALAHLTRLFGQGIIRPA